MTLEAQQKVSDLFNSIVSDPNLRFEFNLFDKSVNQKLWSATHCCEELSKIDIHDFLEPLYITSTQHINSYSTTTQSKGLNFERYCSYLHLLLDGFFVNSMSILDTLAHEIWTLYDFQQKPREVSVKKVRDNLVNFHPNSKLGTFLDRRLKQPWFEQFKCYRNCTTHERLIGINGVKVIYNPITGEIEGSKIRLPDDPYIRPFTYRRNREATQYCKFMLRNIQSLAIKVYEIILIDINGANNLIPIPKI